LHLAPKVVSALDPGKQRNIHETDVVIDDARCNALQGERRARARWLRQRLLAQRTPDLGGLTGAPSCGNHCGGMAARAWTRAAVFGLALGGLGSACSRTQIEFDPLGDETGGGSGLDGGGGLGGSGGSGGSLGGSGGAGGNPAGGSAGVGGISSCQSQANSECELCTCDACLTDWEQCQLDSGCAAILDCANATACTGVSCYLGPCNQVIDQNGGPFGDSANLAQNVGNCRDDAGCPCGTGGTGGSGGFGGMGGAAGSGGAGGTGPLACFTCITQKCPEVGQCLFDDACRDGVICALQQCLGSGSGLPNFPCLLGCFNGDFQAAINAFQALQCFFSQCSTACQGSIPGLPGVGGSGGSP
jgi:hypothetical protein